MTPLGLLAWIALQGPLGQESTQGISPNRRAAFRPNPSRVNPLRL